MGGFRLQCLESEKKDIPSRFGCDCTAIYGGKNHTIWELPLSLETLKKAVNGGAIDLPFPPKDDILDKCGRDALSKTLALLQLAWFIVQIAARARQNLAVTELELTTAALASLNIAMYVSWWSKPTDILCPTILETKKLHDEIRKWRGQDDSPSSTSESDRGHPQDSRDVAYSTSPSASSTEAKAESGNKGEGQNATFTLGVNEEVNLAYHYGAELKDLLANIMTSPVRAVTEVVEAIPEFCEHVWKRFATYFGSNLTPSGSEKETKLKKAIVKATELITHFGMSILLIWSTITHLFLALIYFPTLAILRGSKPTAKIEKLPGLKKMQSFQLAFDQDALPVVMDMVFFCENVAGAPFLCLSAFSGTIFGLIHCLAWNFAFPSHVEQVLWRVSSTIIAGLCIGVMSIALVFIVRQIHQRGKDAKARVNVSSGVPTNPATPLEPTKGCESLKPNSFLPNYDHLGTKVVCTMFAICFVLTRFSLITLSIIGLRALPASAFDTVLWSGFIPHI